MIDRSNFLVLTRAIACDYQICKLGSLPGDNEFKSILDASRAKMAAGWCNKISGLVVIWGRGERADKDFRPINFLVAFRVTQNGNPNQFEEILKQRDSILSQCDAFFSDANSLAELRSCFSKLADCLIPLDSKVNDSARICSSGNFFWSEEVSSGDRLKLESLLFDVSSKTVSDQSNEFSSTETLVAPASPLVHDINELQENRNLDVLVGSQSNITDQNTNQFKGGLAPTHEELSNSGKKKKLRSKFTNRSNFNLVILIILIGVLSAILVSRYQVFLINFFDSQESTPLGNASKVSGVKRGATASSNNETTSTTNVSARSSQHSNTTDDRSAPSTKQDEKRQADGKSDGNPSSAASN